MDEKGNVHLVVNKGGEYEDDDDVYGDEDEMGMMGDGDGDEEEFLQMMEQEDALGRGGVE